MGEVTVGEAATPERAASMTVTREFFETLGVTPAQGRASFREEEMQYGGGNPVIVTDAFRKRLPATLRVNGSEAQVVGVLPPGFRFLSSEAQVFLPMRFDPRDA